MTAPAPQQHYTQCVYAKFTHNAPTKNADGSFTQNSPSLVIASSYGTSAVVMNSKVPDIQKPKTKAPQLPAGITLESDERVIVFSQRENEREMSGPEVAQARAWLSWRWMPATER